MGIYTNKPKWLLKAERTGYFAMSLFCACLFVFLMYFVIMSFVREDVEVFWPGIILGLVLSGLGVPGFYREFRKKAEKSNCVSLHPKKISYASKSKK